RSPRSTRSSASPARRSCRASTASCSATSTTSTPTTGTPSRLARRWSASRPTSPTATAATARPIRRAGAGSRRGRCRGARPRAGDAEGRAMAQAARNLDDTLAALAEPTRRRVVDLLRERPRRAGELANAFRVSAPAMSRHLRVLRTRGLVEEERVDGDARVRVYKLRREPFDALQVWLRELEAVWSDQLESFRAPGAER